MRAVVATTPQLVEARGFPPRARARLDPDGRHICSTHFVHEQPGRIDIRGVWFCKVIGQDRPVVFKLDMPVALFNQLEHTERMQQVS